jgi:SAM-dependent methyltransferase
MSANHGSIGGPSPWIVRWGAGVPPGGQVLDVACGGGRHCEWFAGRGCRVLGIDRDPAIARLSGLYAGIEVLVADIEGGPWPPGARRFDAVVVTNYLHRPLMPTLVEAVAPGGWLLYETFAAGNERFGKPSNPDFLLRPGELLELVRGVLRVVAFEDVEITDPRRAMVQRIAARRE